MGILRKCHNADRAHIRSRGLSACAFVALDVARDDRYSWLAIYGRRYEGSFSKKLSPTYSAPLIPSCGASKSTPTSIEEVRVDGIASICENFKSLSLVLQSLSIAEETNKPLPSITKLRLEIAKQPA